MQRPVGHVNHLSGITGCTTIPWPAATNAIKRRATVGDALVASRPRERWRWQPRRRTPSGAAGSPLRGMSSPYRRAHRRCRVELHPADPYRRRTASTPLEPRCGQRRPADTTRTSDGSVVLRRFPRFRTRPVVDGCQCGRVASATIRAFETASKADVPPPRNNPIERAAATVLRSRHGRRRARPPAPSGPGTPGMRVAGSTPRETNP